MKYMSAKIQPTSDKEQPTNLNIDKKNFRDRTIFNEMGFKIIEIKPFIKHC